MARHAKRHMKRLRFIRLNATPSIPVRPCTAYERRICKFLFYFSALHVILAVTVSHKKRLIN